MDDQPKGLMIEGNILKQLTLFALPLLLGNLFQQLYNAVDSAIVGRYVGNNALAAVGSSASVINLLVSFLMGVGVGSSVLIGQYFGAKDFKNLSRSIHTYILFIFISGIIMSIVGTYATPYVLEFINTPSEVFQDATNYLQVIFSGIIFMMFYNMGSGILRALGDSKRPLYYLIIATFVNIVLDFVFIVFFQLGIKGAAYATVIAQAISCILILIQLSKVDESYAFSFKKITLDFEMLWQMITLGIPTGLQNGVVGFSNLIVQGNINAFGSIAMAGCSACQKIDGFAILPVLSYSMAMTTFTAQNTGAKKMDRVRDGVKYGLALCLSTTIIVSILLLVFGKHLMYLFTQDALVIEYGLKMMHVLVPLYFLLAITHAFNGIIRGMGKTLVPMLVMVSCWCIMRMIWITIMVPIYNDIQIVFWGWPITWLASSLFFIIYYKRMSWNTKELKSA